MNLDNRNRRSNLIWALTWIVVALAGASAARAQSCILTRLDTPVLSIFEPLTENQKWQVALAWRYGRGGRHFVGVQEQKERQAEHSEVINDVNLLDLTIRYQLSSRTSFSLGLPYLMAERSGPIRDDDRNLVGRELRSSTRGLGDVTFVGRSYIWKPEEHPRSNITLGVGIKLPTGENAAIGWRTRYVDGEPERMLQVADQSVQPGDGGFGIVLEVSGYQIFNQSNTLAGYLYGTYIVEPQGNSGVPTYRRAPGEEVMSIADQYIARLGLQLAPTTWKGWSVGLGGRIEGIPVRDLIGSSDGFRRPGYIVSVEPSISWTRNPHGIVLAVPIAVQRNRQQSVPDMARGAHGDASFPDYQIIAAYTYRF